MTNDLKKRLEKQLFFLLFALMLISNAKAQQWYNYPMVFQENSAFRSSYQPGPYLPNYEVKIVACGTNAPQVTAVLASGGSGPASTSIAADGTYTIQLNQAQIDACRLETPNTGPANSVGTVSPQNKYVYGSSRDVPVAVYGMVQMYQSTDVSKILRDTEWGKDYYCINYQAYGTPFQAGFDTYSAKSGYMVVSGLFTSSTTVYENGNPVATLGPGQSFCRYQFLGDMTGTHVTASNPVACFAMSTMADIPASNLTDDVLFEQLRPVEQWGTQFVVPMIQELCINRIRVVASQNGTNISVTGADLAWAAGAQYSLSNLQAGQFVELELKNRDGCYITSTKPVGVCSFMTGSDSNNGLGDPAQVWIPPIEQMDHNIYTSSFIPKMDNNIQKGATRLTETPNYHNALLIVPKATKAQTTGSSGLPLPASWIDVPGSDYSFASWPLSVNNSAYKFDNPGGIIVLVYGIGPRESYYCVGGCGTFDLTNQPGFTVNGDDYTAVEGKNFCDVSNFTLSAYRTSSNVDWTILLNGVNYLPPLSGTTVNVYLPDEGDYTITMTTNGRSYTTHFHVGITSVIWTPEANTGGSDADKQNWNIAANWTPSIVPTACNHVYIPGNCNYYPQLTSPAECNNIYFMQGGELGRVDLLTYKKAFIQYNFGLRQYSQQMDPDKNRVLRSGSTTNDRMIYSAAVSSAPLSRERWYLLTSPLQGAVTGDFLYGGFPLTFLRKFSIENAGTSYPNGNWTAPYNSMIEPLKPIEEAFAFYMYGWGNSSGDNSGCYESGSYDSPYLNDMTYLPNNRQLLDYGLRETNGILELPFFADSTNLYAHRIQIYNAPTLNSSSFYEFYDYGTSDFNKLTGDVETLSREDHDGNYRFIGEIYDNGTGQWRSSSTMVYNGSNLGADQEFLIGNPYISSLDMVSFLRGNYNNSNLQKQFRIWNGTTFITYLLNTATNTFTYSGSTVVNPGYVAPLQAFLVKTTNSYVPSFYGVYFDATTMSKVRPNNTISNLRNTSEAGEENILRIQAENDASASYALIGYMEGASNDFVEGEDVPKLFSPLGSSPEVFSLAGDIPTDINFISNDGEITVPLGIKTKQTGEIRLTFTGMNNYFEPSKIEFIDAFEDRTIDISGMESYTYTFNQTETDIQNGRFSLRFGSSETALPKAMSADDLRIYGDSKGIYVITPSFDRVQQVIVYDFQGRKMFESTSGANYYPMQENLSREPLIVKVRTLNQTKTAKLNSAN